MPNRACDRHDSGPRNPLTPGSSASSPTSQSSSTSSLVTLARSDHLPWMSRAENPGVFVGTKKPRTVPSSLAHTSATCATEPFVLQRFVPGRRNPPCVRVAVVSIPDGFEPKSGSVNPKHPITRPAAISGNHFCFCCSEPNAQIGYITSEPCTEQNDRIPESPR